MKKLLLTASFLLSLTSPVLARTNLYYSSGTAYQKSYTSSVTSWGVPDNTSWEEPSIKIEIKDSDAAYIGEYDEGYYINPSVTPYYYPDNNQKSHQEWNPYNYIY